MNLTALETAFKEFNITLDLVKGKPLEWPRIRMKDAWITMGNDKDLNKALEILKAETVKFLVEEKRGRTTRLPPRWRRSPTAASLRSST